MLFIFRDKSREIERRRRLLTEDEGRRKGPPPEDPPNVYDYYSVRIQATIRGFLARAWSRWCRDNYPRAVRIIQAAVRVSSTLHTFGVKRYIYSYVHACIFIYIGYARQSSGQIDTKDLQRSYGHTTHIQVRCMYVCVNVCELLSNMNGCMQGLD